MASDPYFETGDSLYKECTNPNDPNDKSLCVIVQDASPFDGAVVRYTSFKLVEQELDGNDIACQYEYEIEVPPHDLGYEITDKEGIIGNFREGDKPERQGPPSPPKSSGFRNNAGD